MHRGAVALGLVLAGSIGGSPAAASVKGMTEDVCWLLGGAGVRATIQAAIRRDAGPVFDTAVDTCLRTLEATR